MIKVFITREVKETSPLLGLKDQIDLTGHSLLTIKPLVFNEMPKSSWLFFYSANGVRSFYNNELVHTQKVSYKVGVMGAGTAAAYREATMLEPDFLNDGTPMTAANYLSKNELPVTFIQGTNSKESVAQLLHSNLVHSLEVYENTININATVPEADIYILTSPQNARAFMSQPCCRYHFKVIAIGQSTMDELCKLGYFLSVQPQAPSESAILDLLIKMI